MEDINEAIIFEVSYTDEEDESHTRKFYTNDKELEDKEEEKLLEDIVQKRSENGLEELENFEQVKTIDLSNFKEKLEGKLIDASAKK